MKQTSYIKHHKYKITTTILFVLLIGISTILLVGRAESSNATIKNSTIDNQISNNTSESSSFVTGNVGSTPVLKSTACKLLNPPLVQKVFYTSNKLTLKTDEVNSSNTDMSVSTCIYITSASDALSAPTITFVAHSVFNALGKSENDIIFGSQKPKSVENVSGIGQSAYWSLGSSQLNFLVNNNWYCLSESNSQTSVVANMSKIKTAAQLIAGEL